MKTKRWLSILCALIMLFSLSAPAYAVDGDLITNGDFDVEISGGAEPSYYSSDYNWWNPTIHGTWDPGLGPEYRYTIGTDPNHYHSAWTSFADHTTDDLYNQMMIVNAKPTEPAMTVWQQTVAIPERAEASVESSFELLTGRDLKPVGEVLVKEGEDGKVCVKLVLDDEAIAEGWRIKEAHVDIASDALDIPQKNGNPIPGQFQEHRYFDDPGVSETEWICLEWDGGFPAIIAAHAAIQRKECLTIAEAGSEKIISDTSTIVTVGNLGTEPHAAVAASPAPAYAANTWTAATGSNGWSTPSPLWIWESDPETLPRDGAIVTFEKIFNIPGAPANSELKIAADNGYAVWVNDHFIGSDNLLEGVGPVPETEAGIRAALTALTQDFVDTTTWQDDKTFTIPAADLVTGTNVLKILAVNEYCDTDDPNGSGGWNPLATTENGKNPGGLVFCMNACWDELTECTTYCETAWGDRNEFLGKNWATYIEYTPETEEVPCDYLFTLWAANAHKDNPAVLAVFWGDVLLGTMHLDTIDDEGAPMTGTWKEFGVTIEDPDPGDHIIRIVDTYTVAWGDDFCIDDISLVKAP